MKKLLALILAMLMCLVVFASCTDPADNETEAPTTGETELDTDLESDPAETDPVVEYDVAAAAAYLNTLYTDLKQNNVTGADFEVVSKVMIAGVPYAVTWATNNEKVKIVENDENTWKVDLEHKTAEEYTYTLTATITAPDNTTATYSLDLVVPVYNVATFEEYMAATQGTNIVVEGIVVAMNSKSVGNSRNHLFLADVDGKGGYYCYQLDMDPVEEGIKIGMTVAVTSVVEPYSGMQELKGGTFAIVDETIKTVDVLDITDKFAAGEDLKNYVGLPVVINGVKLGSQDLEGSHQYLYFELNGKKGYVRSYITDFPTSLQIIKGENNTVTSPDKDAMDKDHADHFGWKASATGILILYSGNPYLIPMSVTPFTNYEEVVVTPAEKVDAELGEIKIEASLSSDKVIDLPATGKYYDDVTLTWATNDTTGAATIADGKLTIVVPDNELTVKVTVTATCGEVTDTKEFTIKLSKSITTIVDALAIGAAQEHNTYTTEKYIVAGIIKDIYQEVYGNMHIVDEFGNEFTVYGTYIEGTKFGDYTGTKPAVGDYIVVIGTLGQYNGTAQMKNADLVSFTTPTTIPGVLESVKDFEKNEYTDEKVIISGVITEVQNTTYGNIVIKDAEGNSILVYGLYSSNGAARYDAMTTKPVVGDTITVLGIVGKYNDAQMKNGWLIAHTAAAGENPGTGENPGSGETPTPEPDPEPTPTPSGKITTIAGALTAAVGAEVEITGTVSEFYQGWNTQYNNCSPYIVDDAGNRIIVFRCNVDVKVGDVIKVVGVIDAYNNVNQIAQGSTVTVVTAHVCSTFTDADCLNAAVCTVCDKVNGDPLGHSYTEGTCTRCGATESTGSVTASKTIAALITEHGWTDKTTKQTFTLDSNVSVKINGGNNTGKAYNGDHIRIYATDTPAGTITISVPEGYELVSVKISAQTGTYAFLSINGSADISNVTTAVSGSSVVIDSVKNGSDGKQARVTAIEVVYQPVAG